MANLKKNQLNQFTTIMVDKLDFATPETTITSNFTQKFWGLKHGGSAAATLKTVTKSPSVIQSGILRITLEADEVSDFDWIHYKLIHASCATQHMVFQVVDYDDSDIYSLLSDHHSDFQSRVPKLVATNSQLSDLASDLKSYLAGISDSVSKFQSDFQSRVPKRVATDSQLSDLTSDLKSYLAGISDVLSDFYSDFQSRVPKLVLVNSAFSDALSKTQSDLKSAIAAGPAATITASDISDIASAVWRAKYTVHSAASSFGSLFSDVFSRIALVQTTTNQTNSRALVIQSYVSDTSAILSDFYSDFQSRVPKAVATNSGVSDALSKLQSDLKSAIAAGPAATITASDISDIASAVWAAKYTANSVASSFGSLFSDIFSRVALVQTTATQTNSRALVIQSYASDTSAVLSDFYSEFLSRVPKLVATDSRTSDALSKMQSDLRSYLAGISGVLSDNYSLTIAFQSDFQSRVPKRVATDSQLSDLVSDIRSQIQETFIVRRNTAQAGAAGSITLDASASATNDIYKGQIIELVSGTGVGQTREIVSYNGTTKVATIFPNWITNPDATSVFIIRTETSPRSHLSDATSDLKSYLVGISSLDSDIHSLITAFQSDFQSRVPKRVATDSQLSNLISGVSALLSDIDSALTSQFNSLSDLASNAYSAAAQANSRALVLQSDLSDVKSRVTAMLPTRIVKNTALSNFMFTMVLASDHITPATGKTVTATRSIDGAAFAACANAVTEISSRIL